MESLQPFGLCPQFLRRGDNHYQVSRVVGMMVLIGDVIHIVGSGETIVGQRRHRSGRFAGGQDIVKPDGTTADGFHRYHVVGLVAFYLVLAAVGTAVLIRRTQRHREGAHFRSVDENLCLRVSACRDVHGNLAPSAIGGLQGIFFR